MMQNNARRWIAMILLALGIYLLRQDHGSLPGYLISTFLVLAFWYLNGLTFALSNLRNILLIALIFGIFVIGARVVFPSENDAAKMGLMLGRDLDPGAIGELKASHEIAMELSLDHRPSHDERYFKVASLYFTQDGLRYSSKKAELDLALIPKTSVWVQTNLVPNDLHQNLDQIRTWLRTNFSYSLTPGSLDSKNTLDQFLFGTRIGFCEHYAASAATLLKLRGYKAKVVIGYAGGSWNPLLHILTYRESDAHAWTEVQDPLTQSWQTIDPTDWVQPGVTESDNPSPWLWICVAVLVFFLGSVFLLSKPKRDGAQALRAKLEKIERRKDLSSAGLTVSERIFRLINLNPETAEAMKNSLALYVSLYFADQYTVKKENELKKSISQWK